MEAFIYAGRMMFTVRGVSIFQNQQNPGRGSPSVFYLFSRSSGAPFPDQTASAQIPSEMIWEPPKTFKMQQSNPVRRYEIEMRRWVGDHISPLCLLLMLVAGGLFVNPENKSYKANFSREFKVWVISKTIYLYIPMQSIPYCLRAERKRSWYFPPSPPYLANGPSNRLIWPTLHNDVTLREQPVIDECSNVV